jgi:SNF2 family DNA or RNA helicase
MPGKFEHIVRCPLSRRQQYLYEEYMGRSSTRSALGLGGGDGGSGNFMGMMNVLMQLRKVGVWDSACVCVCPSTSRHLILITSI